MKYLKQTVALLLFSIVLATNSQTDYSTLIANYKAKIPEIMKKRNVQGASIALIDGDSIVWAQGFGYADKEKGVLANPETLYKIGSVSKLLTGSAVMQLNEQGKLSINDPITKYINDLKMKSRFEDSKEFTIRQVLTHHAGIPSDVMKSFFSYKPEDYTTIVNYLNQEHITYKPDFIHSYSNPAFSLLGVLIERVSKKKYPEYMRNNIFQPLEMNNTCFWGIDKDIEAMSKTYDSKGNFLDAPKLRDIPAGGIWSSVKELSNFLMEMMPENNQNKILDSATKQEIFEVQNKFIPLDVNNPIGIVWEIDVNTKAGNIYNHGGATMAHRAMVAVSPETSLGIVILTNSVNGGAIIGLYKRILEEAAKLKGVSKKIEKPEASQKIETRKLDSDQFNEYQGTYVIPGVVLDIKKKRGNLQTRLQGIKLQFLNIEDNEFIPRALLLGFIGIKLKTQRFYFDDIEGEKVMIQGNTNSESKMIAGQLIEDKKISKVWKDRIGKYELLNQDDFNFVSSCELKKQKGLLILSVVIKLEKEEKMNFAISTENDSLAYILGLGRHGGQAIQIINENNQEILLYSGYKFRRIAN